MSKKVDANHKAIVQGLRQVGAEVQSLADVGRGCVDLAVAYRGAWYMAEVKDGAKSPSQRKLTEAERDWHDRFSRIAPVHVWTSLQDALQTIGAAK